ncbi:MAG: response regulator, partial [Planctomycetota bacterium]|nr:response regulator [Planctomycetota bacterium]
MEAVLDEIDLTEDLRDARVVPPRLSAKATGNSNRNNNSLDDLTRNAGIMIIDDEAYNVLVVRKFLQHAGYLNFVTTTESPKAINLMKQDMPDVVLLDVMMPGVSGIDILRVMKLTPELSTIPVIILTASPDPALKTQALELGATDFLAKPVDPSELVLRVRNVLAAKSHFDMLARYSVELEQQVQARTKELEASRRHIIFCLARASEFRDNDTGHHVIRVGKYAGAIARQLGYSTGQVEALEQAAQLHDVGKIGIPDSILHKPAKLDPEEYEFIKKHPGFGKQIIECMPEGEWQHLKGHTKLGGQLLDVKSEPIMRMASRIALTHHEWWDGNGYPLGLAGEDIPIEGRITAIADVYDALSSKRPYKKPFSREKCFQMLEENRGTQFDSRVLDAFFART